RQKRHRERKQNSHISPLFQEFSRCRRKVLRAKPEVFGAGRFEPCAVAPLSSRDYISKKIIVNRNPSEIQDAC
ncbi:MAG: hypothetical protein J6X47_05815, partial [Clostridia bacterium]|nr:hypothetical protein [Clostridia bacterium]